MKLVNDTKMTSTDNWNVNSLDVSSLKMNIDDNKMDIVITSPNLTRKDYQIKVNNGELSVTIGSELSSQKVYKSRFILPYEEYTSISNETFIKGQLKITLIKKDDTRKRIAV